MVDAPRTVVDLILMSTRLGEDTAYTALNRYLNGPTSEPRTTGDYAQSFGIAGPVTSALDIVRSRRASRAAARPPAAPTWTCSAWPTPKATR